MRPSRSLQAQRHWAQQWKSPLSQDREHLTWLRAECAAFAWERGVYKPGTKEVEQWLSFDLMNTHATEQAFVAGGDSIGLKFDQCFTMLTFDHAHGDHALLSPTVPAETDDAQYVPVSRVTCDSRARRALLSETVLGWCGLSGRALATAACGCDEVETNLRDEVIWCVITPKKGWHH